MTALRRWRRMLWRTRLGTHLGGWFSQRFNHERPISETHEQVRGDKMSDESPRTRNSERTRAAILEAAAEVFEAVGYEGSSIRKVAERAGCTHGTLYLYF